MIVDFKFDIGQTVYYIRHHGLSQNETVEQGIIQGFQIRKTKHGNKMGVDRYNSKSIEERIN